MTQTIDFKKELDKFKILYNDLEYLANEFLDRPNEDDMYSLEDVTLDFMRVVTNLSRYYDEIID